MPHTCSGTFFCRFFNSLDRNYGLDRVVFSFLLVSMGDNTPGPLNSIIQNWLPDAGSMAMYTEWGPLIYGRPHRKKLVAGRHPREPPSQPPFPLPPTRLPCPSTGLPLASTTTVGGVFVAAPHRLQPTAHHQFGLPPIFHGRGEDKHLKTRTLNSTPGVAITASPRRLHALCLRPQVCSSRAECR